MAGKRRRHCHLVCVGLAVAVLLAVRLLMESQVELMEARWVPGVVEGGQKSPNNMLYWRNVHEMGRAIFDPSDYAWAASLRNAWREIRAEFHAMEQVIDEMGHHMNVHDTGPADHWSGRKGWKQLLLLHTGEVEWTVANKMPTTTSLILAWGTPISSAWFSILAPNATLTSHVGEYKGILRYHLAIEVPAIKSDAAPLHEKAAWFQNQVDRAVTWAQKEASITRSKPSGQPSVPTDGIDESELQASHSSLGVCVFEDGTPYSDIDAAHVLHYKEGSDIMFDDNFPHFVSNHARHARRVVLFIDIVRADLPFWLRWINQFMQHYAAPLGQTSPLHGLASWGLTNFCVHGCV